MLDFVALASLASRLRGSMVGGRFSKMEIQPIDALRTDVPLEKGHILPGGRPVGIQVTRPNAPEVAVKQVKNLPFHIALFYHVFCLQT